LAGYSASGQSHRNELETLKNSQKYAQLLIMYLLLLPLKGFWILFFVSFGFESSLVFETHFSEDSFSLFI